MKRLLVFTSALLVIVSVASCNKNLDKVLFGTWNVTLVEGNRIINGDVDFSAQDTVPTGTIRFDSNGKGHQNYSFVFQGEVVTRNNDFKWEANDDEIIINKVGEPDVIWNRILDTETKQIATYAVVVSASESLEFTLTLEK